MSTFWDNASQWRNWAPAACLPDRCFCESPHPGLIAQPVNTWSSLIFILVGVAILLHAWRRPKFSLFGIYALALVLLGLGSALYHASLTHIGGAVDNIGIFLVLSFIIIYNLKRVFPISPGKFLFVYSLSNVALATVAIFDPSLYTRYVFVLLITTIAFTEYLVWRKGKVSGKMIYFWGASAALGVGLILWILDITKVLCNPDSLLQAHAAWHILTALAAGLIYLYHSSVQPGRLEAISKNR